MVSMSGLETTRRLKVTNTVIPATFVAALAALGAGIAPSQAEPISNAYPYCLFGRGGGATTCYFRTRAECGNGCVNNPNYVGDERARAMLAGSGLSLDAVGPKYKAKGGGKALASRSIAAPTRARGAGPRAPVMISRDGRPAI